MQLSELIVALTKLQEIAGAGANTSVFRTDLRVDVSQEYDNDVYSGHRDRTLKRTHRFAVQIENIALDRPSPPTDLEFTS